MHACKVECLCVQEQSWEANQLCSKCFGCTFNKASYEIPWSFFAHKRAQNTALQQVCHQKSRWSLKAIMPLRRVKCNCSALLSHHIPRWKHHVCTAVICFLLGDAGNSCSVYLITWCTLSLTMCLISPLVWDSSYFHRDRSEMGYRGIKLLLRNYICFLSYEPLRPFFI